MASRTISTRIAIEGESQFKQSIQSINDTLGDLKAKLSETRAEFANNANSMDALQAKSALLNQIQEQQRAKVDEVRLALENAKKAQAGYAAQVAAAKEDVVRAEAALSALRSSADSSAEAEEKLAASLAKRREELAQAERYSEAAQRGVNNWQRQLSSAETALAKTNKEIKANDKYLSEAAAESDRCATSIDQYGRKVRQAGDQTKETSGAVDALAGALMASGLTAALGQVKDALSACIDASAGFQSAMSKVAALSGASGEDLDRLAAKAKEMGAATQYTAAQTAEAFQYMALAGWDSAQMLSGIEPVLDLAAAAGMDLGQASDIVTDYLTAFGLTAQDAAGFVDQLAYAMSHSNTDVTQLGEAYKNCAATAQSMGYSVEDVTAVLMTMANAGVKGGEAGTALNAVMTRLATDTKGCASELAKYGVKVYDAHGGMRDLSSILQEVSGVWAGLTDQQQANLAKTIAGTNQYSSFQTIMAGCGDAAQSAGQSMTDYAAALEDCSGVAGEMADTMLDGLNGKLTLMNSAFDSVKIAIGDALAPALEGLAEVGTDAFSWAAQVIEEDPWLVGAIGGVAAALGVLTAATTAYTLVVNVAKPAVEAFTAALSANPIGLVAVAITSLVAALGTFIAIAASASEETDGLNQRLRESKAAYEESVAAIETERTSVLNDVAALERLASTANKTAAQKAALLALVDELNEKIPGLSLAYDEQTDSLNMTAEAVRDLARAQAEQELQEERIERLKELYKEEIALEAALADAQIQLEQARAQYDELIADWDGNWLLYPGQAAGEVAAALGHANAKVEQLTQALADNRAEQGRAVDAGDALAAAGRDLAAAVGRARDILRSGTEALAEQEAASASLTGRLERLSGLLDETAGRAGLLSAAQAEMAESGYLSLDTVKRLITEYPDLIGCLQETEDGYRLTEGALEDYIAAQQAQYQIAYDNAASAAQAIVDAERDKGTAIDATTGSIKAQLQALASLYEAKAYTEAFGEDYMNNDDWYNHAASATRGSGDMQKAKAYAKALRELEAAEKDMASASAVAATLRRSYGTASSGGTSGRSGTSGGASSSSARSEAEKTQAERDLETYKELRAALDHERAMDLVDAQAYYDRLRELQDGYLSDPANLSEYRRVEEEIYKYGKEQAEKLAAARKEALDSYLSGAGHQIYLWEQQGEHEGDIAAQYKEMQERVHAMAEEYRAQGYAEQSEEIQALQKLWWQYQEGRTSAAESAYQEELADLDYLLSLELISEEDYYQGMERLRDQYLKEDSDQWRSATASIYQYRRKQNEAALQEAQRQQEAALQEAQKFYDGQVKELGKQLKADQDAAKARLSAQKSAAKEAYEAKKAAIKAELELEKERLNAVIEGIDSEIQARKELREDEDLDDAIRQAQKRLDAAKAQLEYARTDEDRAQWSDEIVRREQALAEAVQNKADTEFYRAKELEKQQVQAQIDAATTAANAALETAEKEYNGTVARMEAEYQTALARLDAGYNNAVARLDAERQASVDQLQAGYQASTAELKTDYDAAVTQLEAQFSSALLAVKRQQGVYSMASAAGAALSRSANAWAAVGSSSSTTVNKSASVTVNRAPALTEGQLVRTVGKVLESMGR